MHRTMTALLMIAVATGISDPASAMAQHGEPKIVRTKQSGAWSAAQTWENGQVPAAGDSVLIRAKHVVRYDIDSKAILRVVQIAGTLEFARDQNTRLKAGLITTTTAETVSEEGFDCAAHVTPVAHGAQPSLLVGTHNQPIPAAYTALIRLHYLKGMDEKSCPAIVCCGGRMEFHGAPLRRT